VLVGTIVVARGGGGNIRVARFWGGDSQDMEFQIRETDEELEWIWFFLDLMDNRKRDIE
jgi:hypothetical protein